MLIDDLIINVLIILFIYLLIYIIYFAFNILICTKKHRIGLEHKYLAKDLPGNIIVIVYAKTGDSGVLELVKMLKEQNYPKENYQVHVLFDNSTDGYSDIIEHSGAVKVWRINSGRVMGKDSALSWLLERLISFRNVNAFVFLDANRKIEPDFLKNINTALFSSDIVVPATEYITLPGDVIAAVKNHAKKYINRIFNTSRAVLGLMNPLNSGAVAIKQEVLEVLKCVDFEDMETEYKYSVYLASKGHTPLFAPEAKTKISYEYDRGLSLKQKIAVMKYTLSKVFSGNFKLLEFVFSFFKPSALFIIISYIAFFAFLYNFEVKSFLFQDIKYLLAAMGVTLVLFLISLVIASDEKINPVFLVLTPIYDLLEKIFRPKSGKLDEQEEANVEFLQPLVDGIEVAVSDGENILKCLIELKNTGDGMRALFRYKSKTLTSEVYETAKEAIDEIAEKLTDSGLKLHICAECSHFGKKPNSAENSQSGLCSQKDRMTDDIQPETTLLDCCDYFESLSELDNIVNFPQKDEAEPPEKGEDN